LLGDDERLDTQGGGDDEDYTNDNINDNDRIEVNLDDVNDEDDNESLLGQKNNN
jgi:hypothetical protein